MASSNASIESRPRPSTKSGESVSMAVGVTSSSARVSTMSFFSSSCRTSGADKCQVPLEIGEASGVRSGLQPGSDRTHTEGDVGSAPQEWPEAPYRRARTLGEDDERAAANESFHGGPDGLHPVAGPDVARSAGNTPA